MKQDDQAPQLSSEMQRALTAYPRIAPSAEYEARMLEVINRPRSVSFFEYLDQIFARPVLKLLGCVALGLGASCLLTLPLVPLQGFMPGTPPVVAGPAHPLVAARPPAQRSSPLPGLTRGNADTLLALETAGNFDDGVTVARASVRPAIRPQRRESSWPLDIAHLS